MTATMSPPQSHASSLTTGKMPSWVPVAICVLSIVVGVVGVYSIGGFKWGWMAIVAAHLYLLLVTIASRVIEDRRQATDRAMRTVMTIAFTTVTIPLISVFWKVIAEGASRFDRKFFTGSMRITPEDMLAQMDGAQVGGALHAMAGTLIITAIAGIISVPLGLLTAIYLVEYGKGKLASAVTRMVDVMTGVPSIVAGLFAYALFELFLGPGTRSGLSGGVALSLLMTPVVVRSSEEMIRLVPNELREASLALGVAKWRTILKVVLPTAVAGILTGITLAIARVIGETAPLLVTAGVAQDINLNPFSGRMTTLPVFSYYEYVQPGVPPETGIARAWGAAMMLVMIVAVLFTGARIMSHALKPKGLK
ncbi:MAG: phosphate ABC transporter permease PstA [Ilumatobacteraceae bacterium]|nr:phosphate ABC transporter permease PstA [Ilumatobacteraceae bacterium]